MKNAIAVIGVLFLVLIPAQITLAEEDCDGVDELRIYSGHIARWLGVDPQADKYPDVSPYVYCEDNPLMYVDPDGEKLHLSGDETDAGFDQLQKSTQLELQIGDDGYVSYNDTESRKSLTKADKKLKKIIDSDKILVDQECTSAIVANGTWFLGGTFDGSTKHQMELLLRGNI